MITDEENELRNRISALGAMRHVEALARIGDRFVGTKGDKKTIVYVEKRFKELGLTVDRTPICVPSFQEKETTLTIIQPQRRVFRALASYFTPATPKKGLEAPLAYVGDGDEEDYAKGDVRGKIVVVRENLNKPKFWLGRDAAMAAKHGAVGLVSIHSNPLPYRTSFEIGNNNVEDRFPAVNVPTAVISCPDGEDLLYILGHGETRGILKVDVKMEEKKSFVIRGTMKGDGSTQERISIIAHRDNGIPPGANDNASGTGAMLEIARALKGLKLKRTVEFISCTAEEGVTAGAYQYVKAHEAEMPQIKALFNIDMISTGGRLNLVGRGIWPDRPPLDHSQKLNSMLMQVAGELGYSLGSMVADWGVSESGRFIEKGVPAAWFWKPDDPYYHTTYDSPERLEPNVLKVVADIVAITILRLANMERIPALK